MQLEFHDAANIFPLIEGREFDDLVSDIREHGLCVPIKLLEGKIIDGRNRYRACKLVAGSERFETVVCNDPVAYVVSLNKHRRQLTPSQLAMVGARVKEYYAKEAKERQGTRTDIVENLPQGSMGRARDLAGKAVGVSGKSIDHAAKVIERGIPELAKAVDEGRMAVSTAAILATEPEEVQRAEISDPKRKRQYTSSLGRPKVSPAIVVSDAGRPQVRHAASTAMQFAQMAVLQLQRIQAKDSQREEAFAYVEKWIENARSSK